MLTYEQACCLVLGLEVNPENEVIAVEQMEAMKIAFYRSDPDDPATIAAMVQRRNPIKCKLYPSEDKGNLILLEAK